MASADESALEHVCDVCVTAVSLNEAHSPSKQSRESISVLAGLGVEGDAHSGSTVKHRSRVRSDPTRPNLRQVHLIHSELHDELRKAGFEIDPGEMGENLTTRGIDLLALPAGAHLRIGSSAVLEVTGLRNPCAQLDTIRPGLMKATLDWDGEGNLIRKAGIMSVVAAAGEIRPGDPIRPELPRGPFRALEPV